MDMVFRSTNSCLAGSNVRLPLMPVVGETRLGGVITRRRRGPRLAHLPRSNCQHYQKHNYHHGCDLKIEERNRRSTNSFSNSASQGAGGRGYTTATWNGEICEVHSTFLRFKGAKPFYPLGATFGKGGAPGLLASRVLWGEIIRFAATGRSVNACTVVKHVLLGKEFLLIPVITIYVSPHLATVRELDHSLSLSEKQNWQ
jgi:hypothetical protein